LVTEIYSSAAEVLHTIYLGVLQHMMKWIVLFLKEHKRMAGFDQVWIAVGVWVMARVERVRGKMYINQLIDTQKTSSFLPLPATTTSHWYSRWI
jgi:hypothetical protein